MVGRPNPSHLGSPPYSYRVKYVAPWSCRPERERQEGTDGRLICGWFGRSSNQTHHKTAGMLGLIRVGVPLGRSGGAFGAIPSADPGGRLTGWSTDRVVRPMDPTLEWTQHCAVFEAVTKFVENQHGVVGRHQLADLGLTKSSVYRLTKSPQWEAATPRVLRRRGTSRTKGQGVAIAVLDAGPQAFLSHESAAAWWGHRGSNLDHPVHVSISKSWIVDNPIARVHRIRSLPPLWRDELMGVPTLRPEYVALHLFATSHYERAERIVETMWSGGLLDGRSLIRFLATLAKRGRNGVVALRRYLDVRGPDYIPSDSGLESRTRQLLEGAGILLRQQVNLGSESSWLGRVDFCHPTVPFVLEVQSEFHHGSLVDSRADARRIGRLSDAGFVVVEITDIDVWTRPSKVVSLVRAGIAEAHRHTQRSVL